jgi:O-succinylbenzoic acid--CoA ligase
MLSPPEHPVSWLQACAEETPAALAIRGDGGEIAYGDLWRALGGWVAEFADDGFDATRPVALLTNDRSLLARAVWLALYAGCPVLPLDPGRPTTLALLDTLAIDQVIADDAFADLPGVRYLAAARLAETGLRAPVPPTPRPPRAPQLLITTSGTEGTPKAVMLGTGALSASATSTCEAFDLGAGDRWLCSLPVVHIGGLMILFRCARAGATVELRQRFDPAGAWIDLQGGITHTSLAPAMLHCILDAAGGAPAPAGLRHVLIGGAPLPSTLARRAAETGWPLTETFGMSETATHVALVDPDTRALRPMAGCGIDLVDLGVGEGEPGRLRLEGPTLMLGYANPALVPGTGLDPGGGLLTSDLGRPLDNGLVRLVGREDDVIICGGLNIHPVEVETMLAVCPDVDELAIAGRPDPVWGEQLVALYVGAADPANVADWVGRRVPGRFRPRAYARVPALPRNPLGKLQRDRLAEFLDPERLYEPA